MFNFADFIFPLNKNLYVNLCDKKDIDDAKMKFGLIAQRKYRVQTIIVDQICLNSEWCKCAFI